MALIKFSLVCYLILGDIHGNLEAFQAVLGDARQRGGFDQIWCLGDIVGYGADPRPCLELLRQHTHIAIAGNHDWAAIGKLGLEDFNPLAAQAARWTASQLSPEDIRYLDGLPLHLIRGDFTLAHGSPRYPLWEYLLSAADALANFPLFSTPYCLVGHSHVPLLLTQRGRPELLPPALSLGEERLIINPGGVGQPRDGDPRASYALYDQEKKTLFHLRVPYDIATAQEKMVAAGLPLPLAARLSLGR